MPKISQYPDGNILTPTDQLVIVRSGKNYQVPSLGFISITPINMVDTLGTTWSNYAAPVGTYNFNLQDANHNLPAGIRAVLVRGQVSWASSNNTYRMEAYKKGGATNEMIWRALVANIISDGQGIISVGTDDDITVGITNSNASSASLFLLGYFI